MTTTRPIYIAIEGVIGVGKTTLATRLQDEYTATLVLEVFEENPFLPLFYADPERYGFQTQTVFLLSRYHQQRVVREQVGQVPLISDYLFAKDRLFARLNLHGDEWETYEQLHRTLAEQLILPDLTIYLRASVETLMARIARRGRSYERDMSRDYIARLAAEYDSFFGDYRATPLLIFETDGLDVVEQPDDWESLRARIRERVIELGQADTATLAASRVAGQR